MHRLHLLSLFATLGWLLNVVDCGSSFIRSGKPDDVADALKQQLLQTPVHQPEVFSRAVQILESIESAPSCHRLATFDLIETCQSLEPSADSEISLASIRERYATRLAMCELTSANVPIPAHCDSFVPSVTACQQETFGQRLRRGFRGRSDQLKATDVICYPQVSDQSTRNCLSSLHSKPQWWTSYSNALQNVLIVCQAGRNAVEKDEILHSFRKNAQVSSEISSALITSLQQATDFTIAAEKLKSRMLQDWQQQADEAKRSVGLVVVDIQKAIHSALKSMDGGILLSIGKLKAMHQEVQSSHVELAKTNAIIETLRRTVIEHDLAVQAQHDKSIVAMSSKASMVEEQLGRIVNVSLAPIKEAANDYLHQLRNFSQVVTTSSLDMEHHLSVNTEKLERQADAIAKIQAPSESMVLVATFMLLLGMALPTLGPFWSKLAIATVISVALLNLSGGLSLIGTIFVQNFFRLRSFATE